jgi:hypothetical protein
MGRHNVYQDLLSGMLGSQAGDLDTQERSVVALATGATNAGVAGDGSETRRTDGDERPRDQEFCTAALAIDVPEKARVGPGVVDKEADACEELKLSASVLRNRCAPRREVVGDKTLSSHIPHRRTLAQLEPIRRTGRSRRRQEGTWCYPPAAPLRRFDPPPPLPTPPERRHLAGWLWVEGRRRGNQRAGMGCRGARHRAATWCHPPAAPPAPRHP